MSHVDFFQPLMESLPYMRLGQVSAKEGFTIEILPDQEKPQKFGFDDLFQIREKIQLNLAEIQSAGAKEQIKEQLDQLKGKLIEKINADRGRFRKISGEEAQLLDAYFSVAKDLLDQPISNLFERILIGTLGTSALGALGFGAYRFFS